MERHICPVCGKYDFDDPDSDDESENCGWISDWYDEKYPDEDGGVNDVSLYEAIENYKKYGVSDPILLDIDDDE